MKKEIEKLIKKHHLEGLYRGGYGSFHVNELKECWELFFGNLPQLTFFIELSELCKVPLDTIKVESENFDGGCETCGYGAGEEYKVMVPRNDH